jgi:hypothetical protein
MSNPSPGVKAVRGFLSEAKPLSEVRRDQAREQKPKALDGMPSGIWTPDALGLPPECPVTPLGYSGGVNYFLDPVQQLVTYQKPYGQADTLDLFRGRHDVLHWAWPKERKDGKCEGWRNEVAREALVHAATQCGPWSPVEKVRGRGGWLDPDGNLVVHCGDAVFTSNDRLRPGLFDGYVYPTRPPIPYPEHAALKQGENPCKILRPWLKSWQWARPDVDPQLLLGWIGVAFLGAALPWRSTVFITGDKAAGKSTLQALIKGLLGDWLIQATDTSAAGIYQHVGQDCCPVAIDELEGESDVRKQKAVLKLARLAASGGLMLRGGDRHQGVEFQARSAFLFSSINTPPLEPQDLSRMAILRLHRLPLGQAVPDMRPPILAALGRCILRRLIDQWPRFFETWGAFKAELAVGGMDGRGQDTFGTLLALADMIEFDGWDADRLSFAAHDFEVRRWSEVMAVGAMAEFEDASENWRLCLEHLLTVHVDAWRNGTKTTVGQVLEDRWKMQEDGCDIHKTNQFLAQAGLRIVPKGKFNGGDWLAIPNQSPLTRRLFEHTKWAGEPGAGVWAGALRQSPIGDVHEMDKIRINGPQQRCTLIRLSAIFDDDTSSDNETTNT